MNPFEIIGWGVVGLFSIGILGTFAVIATGLIVSACSTISLKRKIKSGAYRPAKIATRVPRR